MDDDQFEVLREKAFRVDASTNPPHTAPHYRLGAWCVMGGTSLMAEGYCVKCKAKKEIADGVEEVMKNGRKAIKGKCPTCGTVMFKILGGKSVIPNTPTTPPSAAS